MIHRHTEIWILQANARDVLLSHQISISFKKADSEVVLLFLRGSPIFKLPSETLALRYYRAFYSSQLLLFYFDLSGLHLHWLSSVKSSQRVSQVYPLCRFCQDFHLGSLVPALPSQDCQCHLKITDWLYFCCLC